MSNGPQWQKKAELRLCGTFFYGLQQRRGAPGPPYNRGSLLGELYPGTEKGAFSKEKTPEFAGAGDGI